ncbi:MAG: hypothetical protein IT311_05670 [Anaerolineales bacterium]|nr:hypothetical protein [Anaerolineales bacterium]
MTHDKLKHLSQQEILNLILSKLKTPDPSAQLEGLNLLQEINFSSVAIRQQVEKLSMDAENKKLRLAALETLNLEIHQAVQKSVSLKSGIKLENRKLLLREINEWILGSLINSSTANILRRRYDFDLISPTKPALIEIDGISTPKSSDPEPVQVSAPTPIEEVSAPIEETHAPVQVSAPKPIEATPAPVQVSAPKPKPEPELPRPTLLQTLTSETSIKIYLYLGAFFVIAAAAILGAAVPEFRLPILILGTFLFGGLAVAIKNRLPQPSFALFIVFSFLLPITGNNLADALRSALNLSPSGTALYWSIFYLLMAPLWSGGVYLYQSRLFSVTAFGALVLSAYNVAKIFTPIHFELVFLLIQLTTFAGLAGVSFLRKWKDSNFALPLFLSTQFVQFVILFSSVVTLTSSVTRSSSPSSPWQLASFFTWALASLFYVLSKREEPKFIFEWLAAGALVPLTWFIIAAFGLESFGSSVTFFIWGIALTIASEGVSRSKNISNFGLPLLYAGLLTLVESLFSASVDKTRWLMLLVAFGIGATLTALHLLRSRWLLWVLALLNFIIAYFAFFNLKTIQALHIPSSYQIFVLSALFLLPDLFLKKDWLDRAPWRIPLRVYGIVLVFFAYLITLVAFFQDNSSALDAAIIFTAYAIFFAIYAPAYRTAQIGYISTGSLALAFIFVFNYFKVDAWLPALTILSVLYLLLGLALQARPKWSFMLRNSALILGGLISFVALITLKETGGWYALIIGLLFVAEMILRKNGYFELGGPVLFSIGVFLILRDFNVTQAATHLTIYSLIWLGADIIAHLTFTQPRPLSTLLRATGAALTLINYGALISGSASALSAAVISAIYTAFFIIYALIYRAAWIGYISTGSLALAFIFIFNYFKVDAWLPTLTILSVLYFLLGLALQTYTKWSLMLRNSALVLGALISLTSLALLKETSGWYVLIIGLLFVAEMILRKNGYFELGGPVFFSLGVFLILHDFNVTQVTTHLMFYSLIWLGADLVARLTFTQPRPLSIVLRLVGTALTLINYNFLLTSPNLTAAIGFAIYALLFLTLSLLYNNPILLYAFTLTLPISGSFLLRLFGFNEWIHPVIIFALAYYAVGHFLRLQKLATRWASTLLISGLGLGILVSLFAPSFRGVDVMIPVTIAATLWAVEAFARKDVYLAFPANGLYLWAYFILLNRLNISQPQFFSIGAALLGLIQHYLLVRAGSKTGAYIMGMLSQFILVGTSYIQMVSQNELIYFFALFVQAIFVLFYGIVIRSRSLTLFPIFFVVVAVVTIVLGQLQGIATILLVGCSGITLLTAGIFAVLLRERIAKLSEVLSSWQA